MTSACRIVAELSANHNQSLETAVALVHAAAGSGADVVKTQTYTADSLTIDSDRPWFRIQAGTSWDGETLHDLYDRASTPLAWQAILQREARRLGMGFVSTPFDAAAVDHLAELGVDALKVASFELVDIPLLENVGRTGLPVILSTGMAEELEIAEALQALEDAGAGQVTLLKCTSSYPAPDEEMNLAAMLSLRERFGKPVGLSDHSMGNNAAMVATALGARVIEKHLCLSRDQGGPDASFSLEPAEFATMVGVVRAAERVLGTGDIGPSPSETSGRYFRRSLFVTADMSAGERFTSHTVRSIRPSLGLHPRFLPEIVQRRASRPLTRGTPLDWSMIEGGEPRP